MACHGRIMICWKDPTEEGGDLFCERIMNGDDHRWRCVRPSVRAYYSPFGKEQKVMEQTKPTGGVSRFSQFGPSPKKDKREGLLWRWHKFSLPYSPTILHYNQFNFPMKTCVFLLACCVPTVSAFGSIRLPSLTRSSLPTPAASREEHHSDITEHHTNDEDTVAKQTADMLHATTPERAVWADDDQDDDEPQDFDPATQIFDATSFWTERSGRFPRKK